MKKSDKKLLIGTASVVLLIIVGVIACLIFKISYVLETPAPGYVYLYGYSAMKIDYGASTSVTKSSTVISLEGLPEEKFIYQCNEYLQPKSGVYMKKKNKEPILTDEYEIESVMLHLFTLGISSDDVIINNRETINQLLDLRRNGELIPVKENGMMGDSRICDAIFIYDVPCEFFWETDVEITNDGRIFLVFDEGKTGDRYAFDATEVLKDILGDYLPKEQ